MDGAMEARYWCHMCSQMVNPVMEIEIKCPLCQSGFVEEMGTTTASRDSQDPDSSFGSDHAFSLWAPILLGMTGNTRSRLRRLRRMGIEEDFDINVDEVSDDGAARHERETELDHELESIIRRRRRRSGAILQLLEGIRAGMIAEANNIGEGEQRDTGRERERERVILINSFNQTVIVQGSRDSSVGQNQNQGPTGSLGDYVIGPGLDLLLQHLADNDPNRYGTPPAQKEAIEAMPTVTIEENLQCSVCLDDFEIGSEAQEMPCKHKFHSACILPWLELHSSCPVCRFQLPSDESKLDSDRSRSSRNQTHNDNSNDRNGHGSNDGDAGDREGRSVGSRRFSIPWPFNGLFSSSSGNSSSTSSSSSNAAENPSQADEN